MHASFAAVLLPWTQLAATALVPPLFGWALVMLRKHKINTTVIEAVGRAAGEAWLQMEKAGADPAHAPSVAAAVAEGRDYLLKRIPDALKSAGVTPEGAAQMVSGELGKLVAHNRALAAPMVAAAAQLEPAVMDALGTRLHPDSIAAIGAVVAAAVKAVAPPPPPAASAAA